MRKATLNFLGRKNQSLFDTNVKMKEIDNVDFVPSSTVVTESGTASVRARPTVKHHASTDNFQGFAVPTPKVPVLPPINGPKINGSVGGSRSYNGSVISVPDLVEGEILVPPHPSVAPPPPPGTFILPPPDFLGDLNSQELANLQAVSVPAPKPMALAQSGVNEDLSFLKPPSMAPPKVPSSGPASPAPIYSPTQAKVPQHPSYAPPMPPTDKQFRTEKTPPPKPLRFSSVSSLDSPPLTPAPPPPAKTPALSTFNPQNKAKLYNVPKPTDFGVYEDLRPKQMLLMEDSVYANSVPKVVPTSKPTHRDAQDLKETLRSAQPSKSPLPEVKKEARTGPVEISKMLNGPSQKSPQLVKVNGTIPSLESTKSKFEASQDQNLKFSPLLDRKLRNIKGETNGPREGSAASPLALLKAAKEREKHRSVNTSLQDDNTSNHSQPGTGNHLSYLSQNSSAANPQQALYSSVLPKEQRLRETPKSALMDQTQKVLNPAKYDSTALIKSRTPSTGPAPSQTASTAPPVRNLVEPKQYVHQSPSRSQPASPEDNKAEVNIPFLPPPPEFGDFMEPPPSILPPDPPKKKVPVPTVTAYPQAPAPPPPPPPPPKAVAPPPTKFPVPDFDVKLKPTSQTTPKPAAAQQPATLSPSQVTLLSILQKKMLEMDQKMSPMNEAESNSDDWGSPLSDENNSAPVVPKVKPQTKSYPAASKATALDMRELENKMARKPLETSSVKLPPTSNGSQHQSKHQYGMTLTVRPGTRNPITVVRRGDP
ncbi:pollen-specific leucine-rich repeat extensin-like protein 1 [Salarias fasciatus]|uniref:pollen-specific leucine-rich repeat extensin-like protein 1 n=1 Tax=Salarias fasciatus TaxID=181472 RepID=UPI001176DDEE|nr:pollen-specific leucine-rich repeat extensin-like protein 1 [Salarias fasciatus]